MHLRIFFVVVISLLLHLEVAAQSRIVTTAGNVYSGTVLHEDANTVTIMTTDSARVILGRDRIATIEYARAAVSTGADSTGSTSTSSGGYTGGYGYTSLKNVQVVSNIEVKPLDSAWQEEPISPFYVEAGGSIGIPGGANLHGAFNAERWVGKVSAGTAIFIVGGQVGISRKLIWAESFEMNLGLATGMFLTTDRPSDSDAWLFLGPVLEFKIGPFFLEGGVTGGIGSFKEKIVPIGQIGLRFRIIDLGNL